MPPPIRIGLMSHDIRIGQNLICCNNVLSHFVIKLSHFVMKKLSQFVITA